MAKAPVGKPGSKGGKGSNLSVLIPVVVFVAAAAGVGWWFCGRSTPERVVGAMFALDPSARPEEMRHLFSAASGQYINYAGQFLPQAAAGSGKASKPDVKVGQAKVDGEKATVPVTVKTKTGQGGGEQSFTMSFVCVKEKGKWLIDLPGTVQAMLSGRVGMGGSGTGR